MKGHGTEQDYQRHRYYGSTACDACKWAHARHERRRAAGLPLTDPITHAAPPAGMVDVADTRDLLRDLAVMGWSTAEIGRVAGYAASTLAKARSGGRRWVTADLAADVASTYNRLHTRRGPCAETAREAAELGWDADTAARDAIDEVAVLRAVAGDRNVTLNRGAEMSAAVRLLSAGYSLSDGQIAARLGVSDRTVLRIRQRLCLPAVTEVHRSWAVAS